MTTRHSRRGEPDRDHTSSSAAPCSIPPESVHEWTCTPRAWDREEASRPRGGRECRSNLAVHRSSSKPVQEGQCPGVDRASMILVLLGSTMVLELRGANRTEIRCLAVSKAPMNSPMPCTPILAVGSRIDGPDDVNSPVLQ
jgi:hypothetical protein